MKLLLTGARGFTGHYFREAAMREGYDVISLDVDLTDAPAVSQHIKHLAPEVVVHLAGMSFVAEKNPLAYYDVNVLGTLNLLDALCALTVKPKKVLIASSAQVYGPGQGLPLTETSILQPVNHYATSKLAMENMSRTYLDRLPLFMVRPFNYTGPLQKDFFVIPKLIRHFVSKAEVIEMGNCTVEREFNDVRFVCEAYCQLLAEAIPGEIYNICTGNTTTLQEVIDRLQKLTDHYPKITVNPVFLRPNEIQRLCGCPEKLLGTLKKSVARTFDETLEWMLYTCH